MDDFFTVIYHSFLYPTQIADNFTISEVLLLELKSSDHTSLVKQWHKKSLAASCEDSDVAKLLEEKKLVEYAFPCKDVTCTCG